MRLLTCLPINFITCHCGALHKHEPLPAELQCNWVLWVCGAEAHRKAAKKGILPAEGNDSEDPQDMSESEQTPANHARRQTRQACTRNALSMVTV